MSQKGSESVSSTSHILRETRVLDKDEINDDDSLRLLVDDVLVPICVLRFLYICLWRFLSNESINEQIDERQYSASLKLS